MESKLDGVGLETKNSEIDVGRRVGRPANALNKLLVLVILIQFILIAWIGFKGQYTLPEFDKVSAKVETSIGEWIDNSLLQIRRVNEMVGSMSFAAPSIAEATIVSRKNPDENVSIVSDPLVAVEQALMGLKSQLNEEIRKNLEPLNQTKLKYDDQIAGLTGRLTVIESTIEKFNRAKSEKDELRINSILSDLALKNSRPGGLQLADLDRIQLLLPRQTADVDRAFNSLRLALGGNVKSFYQIKSDFDSIYPQLIMEARTIDATFVERVIFDLSDVGYHLGFYEKRSLTPSELALIRARGELEAGHLDGALFELSGSHINIDLNLESWTEEARLRMAFDEALNLFVDELTAQILKLKKG